MKEMNQEAFEAVARRFRVLADPMRLRIIYHIGHSDRAVGELVELTGGSQSNVSKHLAMLLTHGIVNRRRAGTSVFYSVSDPDIFSLCDQVCGGIENTLDERRRSLAE